MRRLSRDELHAHAQAWIAAWNRRDLDAVLAVFAPDAIFVSPVAAEVVGRSRLHGKAALRAYWEAALARSPRLEFTLIDIVCDEANQSIVVHYISDRAGSRRHASEIMRFLDGRQVYGEALYGVEAEHVAGSGETRGRRTLIP